MRLITGTMAALVVALAAGAASAAPVKWSIPATPLTGGGTISGTFTYDANTNTYSAINIVTTAGSIPGDTYIRPDNLWSTATQIGTRSVALDSSMMVVRFASPLTNGGGTVPIASIHEGDENEGSISLSPLRLTSPAGGAISSVPPATVPTLSEWAMILLGVLLAGGAALTIHRRRTA